MRNNGRGNLQDPGWPWVRIRLAKAWIAGLVVATLAACGGGALPAAESAAAAGSVKPAAAEPARLGAAQLAVLVAEGDALSDGIARLYQAARGLRDDQIVRVSLPAGVGDTMSAAAFDEVRRQVDARVPKGTQALLVTWTRPSRVRDVCTMGLTAALAFGYDPAWCGGCRVTRTSPYFDSDVTQPHTELGIRPAMMLGASTLEDAQALIARGVASEGLMSRGTVGHGYLVRTPDAARSVRHHDFRMASQLSLPSLTWHYLDNADGQRSSLVKGAEGLMFYWTGLTHVGEAATNRWLPGAVADHLTSYGGVLPDGAGQMPATAWLKAGATGSYGTVEEPCNYLEKFPVASVMSARYAAGETLIEAYWKSVRWPGQGLFVGDPLARPWAGSGGS